MLYCNFVDLSDKVLDHAIRMARDQCHAMHKHQALSENFAVDSSTPPCETGCCCTAHGRLGCLPESVRTRAMRCSRCSQCPRQRMLLVNQLFEEIIQ